MVHHVFGTLLSSLSSPSSHHPSGKLVSYITYQYGVELGDFEIYGF